MDYYGQKNYLAIIGANGVYRIDQTGCFLTTISNWLKRRGRGIDPATLNAQFTANGTYTDIDDGIRDDLGPYAFHAADSASNCSGWINGLADTNDAIIEFYYRSITHPTLANGQPNMITHYCLVENAAAHTFVDSWDGQIKNWDTINYGQPRRFARISVDAPTPVVVQDLPKYQIVETYPNGKELTLNKQPTNLWGMNFDFDYMKDHPVEVHPFAERIMATNKVHHIDGYDYYRTDGVVDGFNVADCDDYTPPVAVTVPDAAAPDPGQRLPQLEYTKYDSVHIKRVKTGDEVHLWDFSTALSLSEIKGLTTLTPGSQFTAYGEVKSEAGYVFLVTQEDYDNKTGYGVYERDLEDVTETATEAPAPAVETMNPNGWKKTFSSDQAGEFDAEQEYLAYDLYDPSKPAIKVPKGGFVKADGTFYGKDGKAYYHPITKTYGADHGYGIPADILGAEAVEPLDDGRDYDLSDLMAELKARRPKNTRERIVAALGLAWDAIATTLRFKQKGVKK